MEDAASEPWIDTDDDQHGLDSSVPFLRRFETIAFRSTWNSYAILPTYGATNLMKVSLKDLHARSR
jgi:hypothetical protein